MTQATELQQTKNSFKFIGQVLRVDKDGAFKEEEAKKGKMKGETYRSLRFGVRTSENNEMTVQMYDFEPKEVFLWSTEKRKADSSYKGTRIPYEQWLEEKDKWKDDGYTVLQTNVGIVKDDDGKLITQGLPGFVASDLIFNGIDNGDTVAIEGDIRYSVWINPQDVAVAQKTFTIKRLYKIKDIDFHDEKFEEVTYFEQEMVFVDAVDEKAEKKVYVTGRTIDYKKNFHDSQFVISYGNEEAEDGIDKDLKKMADAFTKKFGFGDVINVFGDAVNRAVVVEQEDESSEEEDLLASLGGKSKPKHTQRWANKSYISEMQITGIDVWDKKVYKESDFVVDNLVEKKVEADDNDFGGKSKKNPSPFTENAIEIDEDDLPF